MRIKQNDPLSTIDRLKENKTLLSGHEKKHQSEKQILGKNPEDRVYGLVFLICDVDFVYINDNSTCSLFLHLLN